MNKLTFEIVQGESAVASENQSLGRVKVRVQPEPKGQQRVLMNILIDVGGKIEMTLKRKADGEVF